MRYKAIKVISIDRKSGLYYNLLFAVKHINESKVGSMKGSDAGHATVNRKFFRSFLRSFVNVFP